MCLEIIKKGIQYELSHLKIQYNHHKRQAEKALYKIEQINAELAQLEFQRNNN